MYVLCSGLGKGFGLRLIIYDARYSEREREREGERERERKMRYA